MSSQSTSPESLIGKLVWVFGGIFTEPKCGIVIESHGVNIFRVPMWIVQVGNDHYNIAEGHLKEILDDMNDED